jgi:perosamine synthetase
LTDLGAAIGRVQLGRLPEFNRRRQANGACLSAGIDAPGIGVPVVAADRTHVYHQYVVTVGDDCPLSRDDLAVYLRDQGIGTAVHYPIPVHEQPLYCASTQPGTCPVAGDLARRVLSLPVHPAVGPDDLDVILEAVNGVGRR